MKDKKLTSDAVADAFIDLDHSIGLCDENTARGAKTSKKKEIFKSSDDRSFAKFTNEIKKRQTKKDGGN